MSPIQWRDTSMWGVGLFQCSIFLPNLVNDKISQFMKATGNEGHNHLIFIFYFAHEFIVRFPNYVLLVSIDWYQYDLVYK